MIIYIYMYFPVLIITFLLALCIWLSRSYFEQFESIEKEKQNPEIYPELYFINLKERPDRLSKIKNELNKLDYPKEKIIRVDAIKKKDGALGCGLSHIKALKMGLKSMNDFIIVLEDDFQFTNSKEKTLSILRQCLFHPEWNVILLSCNGKSKPYSPGLNKVLDCQTASGYIIQKKYIPVLLKEWSNAMKIREELNPARGTTLYRETCIDIAWKKLQDDRWYLTEPKLGKQYASFSSIENKNVNYNV
jgi:glycosyl transferase family 25